LSGSIVAIPCFVIMASTMRAAMLESYGLQVSLQDVPRPRPSGSQVLIQIESATINPSDLVYLQGGYVETQELPAATGKEGAGIVVETGEEAGYLLGKRVAIVKVGTWAQYLLAEAQECIPLHDDIDLDQAASLFINPMTVLMFRDVLRQSGVAACIQTAANSALGRMFIRLCKAEAVPLINIVRSSSSAHSILQEGAENVLISTDPSFPAALKSLSEQLGADLAFDAVGGELTGQLLTAVGAGGVVYVYGLLGGKPVQGVLNSDVIMGRKRLAGLWLRQWYQRQSKETRKRLVEEAQSLLSGVLRTDVAAHYCLEEVQRAITTYAANMSSGKALIHPNRST